MDVPIGERKRNRIGKRDLSSSGCVKFSVVIDSKGRISIPSDVRKTLGINVNDRLDLFLFTSQNKIVIRKNGCGSLVGRTSGCGPDKLGSNPGRGLRGVKKWKK